MAVWGLGGYPIPQYDAPQTRRVQAMTRAFSIARVSLSSEQNSQTLDQSVLPKQTVRSTDHLSGWNAEACAFCVPGGAAEMSKSATAERSFSVRQLRLLVSRPILFVFLKIYFQIFVFQDFKNEEYIMMS